MDTIPSLPVSPNESNDDSNEAVLVLIGFPGCGKSETGNTVTGQRYFKNPKQSSSSNKCVFGDIHVTVRDTPGFESISEFVEIYNSLTDLECSKVVFGLTIGIGRFPTEYTDLLKSVFKVNGIGEHLKRKTFLIFTKVDELLRYGEVSTEDHFEKWLRGADKIEQLVTSLKLRYCVIQNKQSGDKQVEHANLVIHQLKCILQSHNEQDTWYKEDDEIMVNRSEVKSPYDDYNNPEDKYKRLSFDQIKKKEFTITLNQASDWIEQLQNEKNDNQKIDIMHYKLKHYGIETPRSTNGNAARLIQEFNKRDEHDESWNFFCFPYCSPCIVL